VKCHPCRAASRNLAANRLIAKEHPLCYSEGNMKRLILFMYAALWGYGVAFSQNSFSQGEALFMQNKPADALGYLEAAVSDTDAPVQAFLYLGMAYQQLNRLDDALAVYEKVLPSAGDDTALVAYTLGNVYYSKGDFPSAEQCYTQALAADASYASAYLNRANTRLRTGAVGEAAADFEQYLTLEAATPKRPQIEQILAAIQKEADDKAAEAKRKDDEEERTQNTISSIQLMVETMRGIFAALGTNDFTGGDSDQQ
jgi:tetratricopeptide (TPR) repeat protein